LIVWSVDKVHMYATEHIVTYRRRCKWCCYRGVNAS